MSFYINLLYVALLGVLLSYMFKDNKKLTNIVFILESLFFMLIVALRNEEIGTDTETYCYKFLHPNYEIRDWGFYFYNLILGLFTKDSDVFIFVTAILSILPIYFIIWKDSRNKCFSLFVFLTMGTTILYYALYFASMRHCFAVGLLMFLAYFVRNGIITSKWIILLLCAVIGLVHSATFLFIPVYLVYFYFQKNKDKAICKSIVITILIATFLMGLNLNDYMQYVSLLDMATEGRYGYYLDYVSSSTYMIGTTIPLLLLGILFTLYANDSFKKDLYYVIFIFGVCVNNLMVLAADSSRLTFMYLVIACVIIPNFIENLPVKKSYIKYALICVVLIYYSSKYNHTWVNIIEYDNAVYVPYKTNSLI